MKKTPIQPKPKKLVLRENSLGEMQLKSGMKVMESGLGETFADYDMQKGEGEQDGPNYTFYVFGALDSPDFLFKMTDNTTNTLESVLVNSNDILDAYGVMVGSTFKQVLSKRPKITQSTEHGHTYAHTGGSHIIYELCCPKAEDKDSYTNEEVMDWRVTRIIWR